MNRFMTAALVLILGIWLLESALYCRHVKRLQSEAAYWKNIAWQYCDPSESRGWFFTTEGMKPMHAWTLDGKQMYYWEVTAKNSGPNLPPCQPRAAFEKGKNR